MVIRNTRIIGLVLLVRELSARCIKEKSPALSPRRLASNTPNERDENIAWAPMFAKRQKRTCGLSQIGIRIYGSPARPAW